jgi:hypothetical protein
MDQIDVYFRNFRNNRYMMSKQNKKCAHKLMCRNAEKPHKSGSDHGDSGHSVTCSAWSTALLAAGVSLFAAVQQEQTAGRRALIARVSCCARGFLHGITANIRLASPLK